MRNGTAKGRKKGATQPTTTKFFSYIFVFFYWLLLPLVFKVERGGKDEEVNIIFLINFQVKIKGELQLERAGDDDAERCEGGKCVTDTAVMNNNKTHERALGEGEET